MNDMRKRNLISSVILLLLCIGYGYVTANLATRDIENTTQPSFFPWVITICLGLLSTMLLIQSIFSKIEYQVKATSQGFSYRAVLALTLSIFYLILLPELGFLVANFLLVAGLMYLYGERRIFRTLLESVAITLCIFYLFREVFQIRLPAGIIGSFV